MNERNTPKVAPEWVRETFGATALELGLYEEQDDEGARPEGREAPRPAWLQME
jgi:hypothetical protein